MTHKRFATGVGFRAVDLGVHVEILRGARLADRQTGCEILWIETIVAVKTIPTYVNEVFVSHSVDTVRNKNFWT